MNQKNVIDKRNGFDARLILAAAAAVLALVCVMGAGAAWANPKAAEVDFPSVSDVAAPREGTDSAASKDAKGVENGNEAKDGKAALEDQETTESLEEEAGDEQLGEADAQSEVGIVGGWSFAKDEYTVSVGEVVLVGFEPLKEDAESVDEARVAWYRDWKSSVKEANVSTEESWLSRDGIGGGDLDYDAITGIVTSDEGVFELFGEFPEWKTGEDGVEYRWWYGLLGKAKKAGDVKLSVVFRQQDGEMVESDSCTVHVTNSEASGSAALGKNGAMSAQSVEEEDSQQAAESVSASASASGQASDGTSASSTTGATTTDESATAGGLSSSSSANSTSGLSSNDAKKSNASGSTDAYPVEVAKTPAGAAIAASLLANDAASAGAFAELAGDSDLSLNVSVKDKLGDAAESSITSAAKTAGLDVAERLSVSVVDASGKVVDIANMNLTVKISPDGVLKTLDKKSVQVWYAAEDGKTEKMESSMDDEFLSFATTHLSDFAVMGTKANSAGSGAVSSNANSGLNSNSNSASGSSAKGLPQTGDAMGCLAVLLAFVAGYSASSALNARRRLKETPFDFGKHAV